MEKPNIVRTAAAAKNPTRQCDDSHSTEAEAGKRLLGDQQALLASWKDTLLKPCRVWSPAELIADTNKVPLSPGVYGWWFRTPPSGVPLERTIENSFGRLLYIGIAGGRTGNRTLRDRLKNHLKGPIGSSTLRRTLACLNVEELALEIGRHPTSGRLVMSSVDERKLSEWMAKETRVAWMTCDRPQEIEKDILLRGPKLPLNIQGNAMPFARHLSSIRANAGKQASRT